MQAAIGDRFHVRGNIVGQPERTGEIIEVRGAGGEPPYLVRFDDGHTSLVFPGPDPGGLYPPFGGLFLAFLRECSIIASGPGNTRLV